MVGMLDAPAGSVEKVCRVYALKRGGFTAFGTAVTVYSANLLLNKYYPGYLENFHRRGKRFAFYTLMIGVWVASTELALQKCSTTPSIWQDKVKNHNVTKK